MPAMEQLAYLLLTAERASANGAVTIDLFPRGEDGPGGAELTPLWAGPTPIGRLVAENGRVCWVMAKGCDVTVSDVVAEESGIPREQLEQVYEVARQDGSPFCETLANAGLVSPEEIRKALLRRTAAGAAALADADSGDDAVLSVARVNALSYETRFTYGALEIIDSVFTASEEWKRELARVPASWTSASEGLEAALCFRESSGQELSVTPIASRAPETLSLGDAVDLAMAGLEATQPPDAVLADISPYSVIPGPRGEWWLCSYATPHIQLFQINSPHEYRRVLAELLSTRLADG